MSETLNRIDNQLKHVFILFRVSLILQEQVVVLYYIPMFKVNVIQYDQTSS